MTIAAEILHSSRNANDGCERAEALTNDVDQDWEHEATLYTFSDSSVLVAGGPQLNAFADIEAARASL